MCQSAVDLDSVLAGLTRFAAELCNADEAIIFLRAGDEFHARATYGAKPALLEFLKATPLRRGLKALVPRVAESGAVEHIPDKLLDPDYAFSGAASLSDARTMLGVPLLRDGLVDGVFSLSRYQPEPFSDRQIELLETFAGQAVIAIENVRLFEELQARTAELIEALQQQTATADVLKVISRSAFDLNAVLTTLISSAIQLCDATRGVIWLHRGERLFLAAHVNYPEEWVKFVQGSPITPAPDANTATGIAAFTGEILHVEDMLADPRFGSLTAHKTGDYRAGVSVPLKREGRVVGVIGVSRPEARLFTERQIALIQTFADQAVIAIENVRLFEQVQARTGELTETLDQLRQREASLSEKTTALEALSGKLAKYLAPQVYHSIFAGRQEVKIASQRKKLTICFSDIAGFTQTTDMMESEDLTQLLNHYLTEMAKIAMEHGATIDKYVGDAILMFFGDPETRGVKEDALACVKMALAMQKRVGQLAEVWRDMGIETPLQARIGIHTGYCTVGNFGSDDRMDYTIIGGAVNLASRLEREAKPGTVLISYETFAHVKEIVHYREHGQIRVKGIAHPVTTYCVLDLKPTLSANSQPISAESPHFRIHAEPEMMSAEERSQAAKMLRFLLSRVSGSTE